MAVRVPIMFIHSGACAPVLFYSRGRISARFLYMDIIQSVKKEQEKGSKFGLERTKELLSRLGNPDKKLKIIHVAGTNGKGSVCAYLTGILRARGAAVGTFTSPEVYSFEEQFCINGRPASRDLTEDYFNIVSLASHGMADKPSSFEVQTCAALAMFAGEGLEYCVLECGLGGLEDATNAVSQKEIAVITSISLEHTAVLGSTIADICRHKGGIIRNCPAVVPANLCAEAAQYFAGLGVVVAGGDLKILRRSARGQTFWCGGKKYFIRMHGDEQAYNAAAAIKCAEILGIPRSAAKKGLRRTRFAGRVEVIKSRGVRYILDGSHNPQSFGPLVSAVKAVRGQKTLVFSCLSDKDVSAAAGILSPLFGRVLIAPAPGYRAMDADKICAAFCKCGKDVQKFEDIPSAMSAAGGGTVVVCGTFTILKEARNWIEQRR